MVRKILEVAALALVVTLPASADGVDLDGIKCVVADKPASEAKSTSFKEGKVYFCCGGCQSKFAKAEKKFTAAANRQLVATKQYTQTKCPIAGRDVNPNVALEVDGVKVSFCCNGCKGKVEKTEAKKRSKLVFNEKVFGKAFVIAEMKE